jgi:glutathione synthase/RimK-type ligase-like ATP-grasp enzyme
MGEPWRFLAPMELGASSSLTWSLAGEDPDRAVIDADGGTIDMHDVRAVWNRRMLRPHQGHLVEDPVARQYAQEQWWHALQAVLRTPGPTWVNAIEVLDRARSKPGQLVAARRAGLRVPPTLVTADFGEVVLFAQRLGARSLVTKVVSPGTPMVEEGQEQYMIFTQRVDLATLDRAAVEAAPAIYQPEIPKAYEVRATVVGHEVFGCRIDSTASERTELDWRHYDFERVAHTPIDLPERERIALLDLCTVYGLRFAAADFIVDPAGCWTFLELNPNGQWGWIEEQAGIPIGRHLAIELSAGDR